MAALLVLVTAAAGTGVAGARPATRQHTAAPGHGSTPRPGTSDRVAAAGSATAAPRWASTTKDPLVAEFPHVKIKGYSQRDARSYPTLPSTPLPACPVPSNYGNWPVVTNGSGNPCYLSTPAVGGSVNMSGPTGAVFPGQSVDLALSNPQFSNLVAAWLLDWDNIFDPEPLMRSSTGLPANDTSGYDSFFAIPPSLSDTSCYNPSQGFASGRFLTSCTIPISKGPYYGTPGGQTIPYTVFTAAEFDGSIGVPSVTNSNGLMWHGQEYFFEYPVFLEPSPYAGFTSAQTGAVQQFTDTTLSDLPIVSWAWNFGDGDTSSEESPAHTYADPGPYTVSLKVTTSDGQTDTSTQQVTENNPMPVLSGTVSDLDGNPVQTALSLTNTDTDTVYPVSSNASGSYSVEVPEGNYALDGPSSVPEGTFTPDVASFDLTQDSTDNVTFNGYQLSVQVNQAPTGPVIGVSNDTIAVSGSGTIVTAGPFVTNLSGNVTIEATSGSYTVTPQPLHLSPPDHYTFTPPTATANLTASDASETFFLQAGPAVTNVAPDNGLSTTNNAVTITGSGFTEEGGSQVEKVAFVAPSGKSLEAATFNVVNNTTITATTPNATSLLPKGKSTVTTDVEVTTPVSTSTANPGDQYMFGCQNYSNESDADWAFGGCFGEPEQGDYVGTDPATFDGMTVQPSGDTQLTVDDGDPAGNDATSSGPVTMSLNLKKAGVADLFKGSLNLDFSSGVQTLQVPAGAKLAGLPISGTVSVTSSGGVATGVVTATLPPILGSKTAQVTFVVSQGAGVKSVTVSAPGGGNLGQLFGLTISSFSLDVPKGTWTVSGTATTSSGPSTTFSGTLTYAKNALTGGSLTVGKISVAGILDLSDLTLKYEKGWSGSATVTQGSGGATQSAKVAFGFDDNGALQSGSISTKAITLFGVLPLKSLTIAYSATKGWQLSTTADISGGGTLDASLGVSNAGVVTGGSISLSGGNISLFGKLTLTSLLLSYSTPDGVPTYTGALGVQLPPPATVVTGVTAGMTIANGEFVAGSLSVTGNVPLADGIFLHQIGASFKAPTSTTGLEVCGSVGITAGPTVNGSTLLGLNGAIDYTFPNGSGDGSGYDMAGQLVVPQFVVAGGILGDVSLKVPDSSKPASIKLSLGGNPTSLQCPLSKSLPASPGITLGSGITVTGTLSGDISASSVLLQGSGTFSYPALFAGTLAGNVQIQDNDITACASESGHKGSYGFTLTWDGAFTTWNGNCPEPG
jgi:PKD repeat protein